MNTYIIRSLLIASGFLLASINTQTLYANPDGGNVVAGSATINQAGNTVTVNQSTGTAIINWNGFSIGNGETTRFNQPNSNSIALNRVIGNDPSNIFGNLIANGKIMLINPNGIMFGSTSRVDVAGLIASTADISNTDFLAGNYKFSQNPNKNFGIVNNGEISVKDQGLVALVAPGVENNGIIRANLGKVLLASGTEFTIVDTYGDGLITFAANSQTSQKAKTADGRVMNDTVANHGTIIADGGTVLMTARAAGNVVENVINMDGVIQANSVAQRNGQILLLGGNQGNVKVAGTFRAKGTQENKNGGFIETSGDTFTITDTASVDTRGFDDGKAGTWLIDPTNFTIYAGSGAQTTSGIGADTLMTNLTSGNITLQTMASGSEAGDINVNADITWNTNTLTLNAANNININADITANGTAKLELNYGGTYGSSTATPTANSNLNVALGPNGFTGSVNFNDNSSLSINGHAYTLIKDPAALQNIYASNSYQYFALANDIDMTNQNFTPIIGYSGVPFISTLDGLGHVIKNLAINTPTTDNVGLFAKVSAGTNIRNIGLEGGSITGQNAVGGLIGSNVLTTSTNNSTITISNVYSTANVTGNSSVGGLIGINSNPFNTNNSITINNAYTTGNVTGTLSVGGLIGSNGIVSSGSIIISNAYATGNVIGINNGGTSSDHVGGLIGYNSNAGSGSIIASNVYTTGDVIGGSSVGGLIGYNYNTGSGSITTQNAYATGDVNGDYDAIGGLIGQNTAISGSITTRNAYASGNVTGDGTNFNGVGGLIGSIITSNPSATVITENAYATGDVTGYNSIGGLIGLNNSLSGSIIIKNTYAIGNVTGDTYVGGLIGYNSGSSITINDSFWNKDNNLDLPVGCNGSFCTGINAVTEAELKEQATFTNWDFNPGTGVWEINGYTNDGNNNLIAINNGMPYFQWQYATLVVTSTDQTTTYNGLNQANTINNSAYTVTGEGTLANLVGNPTLSVNSGNAINAGSYTITINAIPQVGYAIKITNGTLTIDPANLTVTVGNASSTYGSTPNLSNVTYTVGAMQNGENQSVLGLTASTTETATSNAGFYDNAITASSNNGNYNITYINGDLTINKAPLTITANNQSNIYSDIPYTGGNGVTYSGFVNGDDISILNGVLSYIGSAQGATAVGSYTITPTNLTAANYEIIFASGTLTIQPTADPSITFFNQNSLANRTNDNKNANSCTDNNLDDKTSSECKNLITVIEKPIAKEIKHTAPQTHTVETVNASQSTFSSPENEVEDTAEETTDTGVRIVDGVAGYY